MRDLISTPRFDVSVWVGFAVLLFLPFQLFPNSSFLIANLIPELIFSLFSLFFLDLCIILYLSRRVTRISTNLYFASYKVFITLTPSSNVELFRCRT